MPDETRRLPLDDPDALGALLMALEPRLVALAARLVRDRHTAEDVVQSAFEKAIRNGHRFRGESRVSTWLHRIVANEALMWLRSHGRRARRTRDLDDTVEDALADPRPDALEAVQRGQRVAGLRAALARLRPEERDVLFGCALGGATYAELGRESGLDPAALKSRAYRARRRLESLLVEHAA
jgi:RNA polymerase sigma-70 factor (ECF subfamily)